jgi:hypothetical protein
MASNGNLMSCDFFLCPQLQGLPDRNSGEALKIFQGPGGSELERSFDRKGCENLMIFTKSIL